MRVARASEVDMACSEFRTDPSQSDLPVERERRSMDHLCNKAVCIREVAPVRSWLTMDAQTHLHHAFLDAAPDMQIWAALTWQYPTGWNILAACQAYA